jgi:scyllo-inositol 2-dehydrogenase (NAD+)
LGSLGTLRIGYLRETPLLVLTKNNAAHDIVPYFPERFGEAYTLQLQNFVQNLLTGAAPPVTIDDGIEALRVSIAATQSYQDGKAVDVATVGNAG